MPCYCKFILSRSAAGRPYFLTLHQKDYPIYLIVDRQASVFGARSAVLGMQVENRRAYLVIRSPVRGTIPAAGGLET